MSNYSGNAITEYAPGAKGDVAPINTIAGSNTQLYVPLGMAMSGAGRLYVANSYSGTIAIFAAGASGNVAPVATISGSSTGLCRTGRARV